jgi:aldehyde dehydrogenase (NAD+)
VEALAAVESRDNGKRLSEVRSQLQYLPQYFYYYAGLADKIEGSVVPIDRPDVFNYTVNEPYGVVAAITPWNSPLMIAAWKLAPALAAGNTVVLKPSEHASASTLEFARLFDKAGFPPGVVNVVTGYGSEVGDALVGHNKVARVTFTGSDAVGRRVAEVGSRDFKRVTLELGGKSAQVVFADANLDDAVNGIAAGIFVSNGQSCMAGSRLLLQDRIYDRFVEQLVRVMRNARLGNPGEPATHIGPISNRAQYEKILRYIEIARADGAKCVLGGRPADRPGPGWFIEPTIFCDVTNEMRIAREEVFGPILCIIRFRDVDEAVAIANDSPFGLAAGVWTSNMRLAMSLTKRLATGTVYINQYRLVSALSPVGGHKHSGYGHENGISGIREYLQIKTVWLGLASIPNPFQ